MMIPAELQNGSNLEILEGKVTELVALALPKKSKALSLDTPLLTGPHGFDSFAMMELIFQLEKTFVLCIPDHDLDPDIFYSIRTIATYLQSRLNQES